METGVRETQEMESLSTWWPGAKPEHHLDSQRQPDSQTGQQILLGPFPSASQSRPLRPSRYAN